MAKKNKRNDGYLSIRKKLIAAIAMLLVASFMVASSSYAWFTLSTAPEVKGIQTAVGANGSLEIALNVTGDANNITSGIGDTGDYTTWGNLIDVSANSFGLQNVTLLPARLGVDTNAEGNSVIDQTGMLQTPVYGADGRIEELKSAVFGSFNTKENQFMTYNATTAIGTGEGEGGADVVYQNQYGVRAIGNSTAMSTQQIDFLNAQYAVALALSSAQTYTSQSLTIVGGDLANIAADKAMGAGTGPYDISNVANMLAKLDAAVAQLDAAALAFCKAQYASTYTGEDYTSARDAKFTATATLDELVTAASNATLTSFWTIRGYIASAVATANDNYKLIAKPTEATYNEANSVLGGLVDMSTMTLNGYTMSEASEKKGEIASEVAGGKGVVVTLKPKSGATAGATQGVYVDMAHLVGNYSAGTVATVNAGGFTLNNVKATMKTDVEGAPTVNLASAVTSLTAPDASENSGGVIINDLYGYVLDLAFRTNAAGSYLMLQTTATDRIYSTGGSQATQGGGSSMTFSSVSTSFTTTQVKNLMQHIRIVFTSKDGTILAVAGLDSANANEVGTEVTAPMKAYDPATYYFDAEGKFIKQGKDTGTSLAFATPNAKGATQLLALTQNEATDICVYVYLDGDYVENKDVANAAASMTGTMNLQFSSSAELVPMSYAPLQDVSGNLATSIPATAGAGDTIALPATVGATAATWYDSENNQLTVADGYTIPTTATVGSYVTLTAKDSGGNTLGTYKIQIVKAAAAQNP